MSTDIARQIDEANITPELRTALGQLADQVNPFLVGLESDERRLLARLLSLLVKEATDETIDAHWWEVAIDLLLKAAHKQGKDGQLVGQALQRLLPMLRQQFGPYQEVTLQEITAETVLGICLLSDTLTEPKRSFVAPNAISLAQAHFNKHAWFRAIYAGRAPVGFVMLEDNAEDQEYFLWRFMIAEPYQGRGHGREAMNRLIEYVKTRPGARELLVSCLQGEGSPEGFYVKLGFVRTGDMEDDEVVLSLGLV